MEVSGVKINLYNLKILYSIIIIDDFFNINNILGFSISSFYYLFCWILLY